MNETTEELLKTLIKRINEECKEEVECCEWVSHSCGHVPCDDEIVLVSWKDADGEYSAPITAIWCGEDRRFKAVGTLFGFPLEVDIWCPIPKLPGERCS